MGIFKRGIRQSLPRGGVIKRTGKEVDVTRELYATHPLAHEIPGPLFQAGEKVITQTRDRPSIHNREGRVRDYEYDKKTQTYVYIVEIKMDRGYSTMRFFTRQLRRLQEPWQQNRTRKG